MKRQPSEQQIKLFNEQKSDLIELLKYDMENREDVHERMFINYLLNQNIDNVSDLERIIFAYNEGNLISYEELYVYDKQAEHKFFVKHFNVIRHLINTLFLFGPSGFILYKTVQTAKDNIVLVPLGIILSLFSTVFFGIAGNTFNLGLAHICGLQDSNEIVQDEKIKRKIGIASGIISSVSIGKSLKKGIKDIANVDSWKEMK